MEATYIKDFLTILQFSAKENTTNTWVKKYADDTTIEVDFTQQQMIYDPQIRCENKTTQNFAQPENFVVLDCVDRLLTTGYKAENIILEKTWKLGHQEKGRLDILVTKNDTETKKETAYLMIECKTAGKEFEKALKNTKNNGGQLFSYFQQDKAAEILMLYTSELKEDLRQYKNEIIKIEEDYRNANNVIELFNKWNKITKNNGVWENPPYNFRPNTLKITDLKDIQPEEGGYIFNRFLEILRHNVVSDKPNAFNKIFNLFLCKIYDEKSKEGTNEELGFQWKEGIDGSDYVDFQIRLTDLYKEGMYEFLEKKVTDFTEKELEKEFREILPEGVFNNLSEDAKEKLKKRIIYKLRLEKNNEFAIKEVFDGESARENAQVLKEIVELLQGYKLRYTKKQQYLSDFFELLLTTGLKQEAGQFFTPVPLAQFMIKSIPIDRLIKQKLSQQKMSDYLPYIIDYAAGSGHFVTESMHEIQKYLNALDIEKLSYNTVTKKFIKHAQEFHFDWAFEYIYGIEKDYRLVKVGKVGCYLHGDGLANVIHSDGLANFSHQDYKGKLRETESSQENRQFDVVVSNPPYSVEAFKNVSTNYYTGKDFELYQDLSDQSSEIEALFVERTKQLLKDGGTAGIILPSSILSNTRIYTKAREIILKYFDIIAITELGSNTFMATGTNTVVLFLRRRDNYIVRNLSQSIETVFENGQDFTLHGIENALSNYVAYVWESISLEDYISFLKKMPNEKVQNHELFKEYRKKFLVVPKKIMQDTQDKAEHIFWEKLLTTEKEKFLYFLLSYNKKVVLVKSGQKNVEKHFLGYEFSDRDGKEGIHPIQKGKNSEGIPLTISDCTKLFDEESFTNPEKASSYVYHAFLGEYPEVHESLKNHISHARLVDMLTFDRAVFEKLLSTSVKKKVEIESKWELVKLGDVVDIQSGLWTGKKGKLQKVKVLRNTNFKLNNGKLLYDDIAEIEVEIKQLETRKLEFGDIILEKSGGSPTQAIGRVALFDKKGNSVYSYSNFCSRIRVKDHNVINSFFLWVVLHNFYKKGGTIGLQNGVRLLNIDLPGYKLTKIPLPPLDIQQKIVTKIEILEQEEEKAKAEVEKLKKEIGEVMRKNVENENWELVRLGDVVEIQGGYIFKSANFHPSNPNKVIRIGDIVPIIKNENFSGVYSSENPDNKYIVKKNDIILGLTGYMGKVGIVLDNEFAYINQRTAILRSKNIAHYKFVYQMMQSDIFMQHLSLYAKGAAQLNISTEQVGDFKLPLPPIEIQQKIVSEIEVLEARISNLESELKEIPKKKEAVLKKWL